MLEQTDCLSKKSFDFRSQVTEWVREAAKEFKLRANPNQFVVTSLPGFTVINIPVVNEDDCPLDVFLFERVHMLVYLDVPEEEKIQRGFYAVRAGERPQIAELVDSSGNTVARGDLDIKLGSTAPEPAAFPIPSLNTTKNKVCADFSGSYKGVPYSINACLTIKVSVEVSIP